MQFKKIKIKQQGDSEKVNTLKDELNIDYILANLLVQRGITSFDQAKLFFRPELEKLHDPFLMKDMHKAVTRLEEAILKNQKILVYGDYDVDGTTSVALVFSFLRKFYKALDFYIPDRYSEGYGISFKGIDYAKEIGVSLIIALDCGIKAVDKVEYATKKGIDFIICDHHTPGDKIPNAVAVLDPKRHDCEYPFKDLSGCGVGFKFLQAYAHRNSIPFDNLLEFVDLTVVSIASDIVPIIGENRILAYFGLKKLNENPIQGLLAILEIARVKDKNLTVTDCVFKIGPRINAAGRIKSGKAAVDLLISGERKAAAEFGKQIDKFNDDRKKLDRDITHQALHLLGNDIELTNRKTTVLYNPKWHKGVVGIVASRLTETYYRPTIVMTESNGKATGSARSVDGFNLYEAVEACSHLLENFGGHMYAAGLTMKIENIPLFSSEFERIVSQKITDDQLVPVVDIDAEINFSQITSKFFRILCQFAPFGPGNMSPTFITRNVKDNGRSSLVGQEKEHLKLEMIDQTGTKFSGIAFSMAHHFRDIKSGKPFTVCYTVVENEYQGVTTLQGMIKEIVIEE